jgi:hypothetical protein
MTSAPQSIELFAASVIEALRTEVRWYLADKIQFTADPEVPDGLRAELPLYGGSLVIRVHAADEWSVRCAGWEGDKIAEGAPLLAVNWGQHPSGAFTCGTYSPGVMRAVWAIAHADAFAAHCGTLPSEDE